MKKLLFTIITALVALSAGAQVNIQFGANYNTQKYAAVELSAGYNFGPALVQGGYLTSLTTEQDGGAAFNLQAGKQLYLSREWYAEPAAGYAYILKSNDHKDLNRYGMIYSLGVGRDINQGSLLLKASYCDKIAYLGIVMRVNFY